MERLGLPDTTLRFAVCDDRLKDRERMERMITAYCEERHINAHIDVFDEGEKLIAAMREAPYTIVFLDIFMDDMNGIEAARVFRSFSDCALVFVTSSPDYALEGFELNAIHYLVKPCTRLAVEHAMERCMTVVEAQSKTIAVKTGRDQYVIRQKDIQYVEVFGNRCVLHTITGDLESYTPLNVIRTKLDQDMFIAPHRSYIVNVAYILEIPSSVLTLKNGVQITVSRKERGDVRQKYLEYLVRLARGGEA